MFVFKFLGDTNFCLASFTILVYLMINNNNKIDSFTNSDGDRSKWFETILWYNSPIIFMATVPNRFTNIFIFWNGLAFWNFLKSKMWFSKLIPGQGLWDIHWREPLPEVSAPLEESIHLALIGESKIAIFVISNVHLNYSWFSLWVGINRAPKHIIWAPRNTVL